MKPLLNLLVGLSFLLPCWPAGASVPPLVVPDAPLGIPGAGLPVNLLLNFAVTADDAGAAYRASYQAGRRYGGYFNPRLCYQYPMKHHKGAAPDTDPGYFFPSGPADAQHACRGAFSGNFLNWASSTTLDLLRVGLTGGDRVIDEPGLTVLQRAQLPDHFPRKMLGRSVDASLPAGVAPFGVERLFIVSCRNQLLFSSGGEDAGCDTPRSGQGASSRLLGVFNAQVQVCTVDDAASRPEFCARYGDSYKPQGVLQTTPHHVGVMSYLSELRGHGASDYGGALRAPLKALSSTPGSAPGRAEWDPATGVLAANPDRAGGGVSGALNVINRLGRGKPERPGAYSQGDPGAELYYEALRYLQGRAASIAPGPDVDDGMPIWRTPADPVTTGCQRNVIATIGHAAFAHDRHVPGNTVVSKQDAARAPDDFTPATPLDVMGWTRLLGELETASAKGDDLVRLDLRANGPAGAGSYYLAGAAYWAHANAIRPDKNVRVDSFALELGAEPRPVGSALYYAAKYGAFNDSDGDGKPLHYHPASGPDEIIPALHAMLGNVTAERGRIAGPGVIGGAGEARYLIQTHYDAATWSGSVQRRALHLGPDGAMDLDATPLWDAAQLLSGAAAGPGPTPTAGERAIFTLARQADRPDRTVPLRWRDLPAEVQSMFSGADGGTDTALGEARVEYLRGERRHEAGQGDGPARLRQRHGVLGDIVRSVPLIIGPPQAGAPDPAYAAFRARYQGRRPVVVVGANDGMLHAFDAASGREQFAYVPNALLPVLTELTQPGYRHRPYVDGSAAYGEAQVRGRWRTVLASGMGMGARGVFALDVTDLADFGSGLGALWEFTERDDPAIGHVSAPPQIVKVAVGSKGGAAQYRYFVLVASGINPADANGRGTLFLLALDKSPVERWQPGLNYVKFVTTAGAEDRPNALSPPVLVPGGDGAARLAYAGDLQGRLWRFDLAGKPLRGGVLDRPLFVAHDASGLAQPIADAPAVVFAPGGGYLVLFGTGKFIEHADTVAGGFTAQSFYALHDRLNKSAATVARAALAARTLSGAGPYTITGKPLSYAGDTATPGWYLDFPDPGADGERAAGSPVVRAGAVMFDTLLPGQDACRAPAYRSYVLDALSGMAFGQDGTAQPDAVTGAMLASDGAPRSVTASTPLLISMGGSSGARHAAGAATVTRRYAVVRPGAAAGPGKPASAQHITVAFTARRLSWRQVANWKDLHHKATR